MTAFQKQKRQVCLTIYIEERSFLCFNESFFTAWMQFDRTFLLLFLSQGLYNKLIITGNKIIVTQVTWENL